MERKMVEFALEYAGMGLPVHPLHKFGGYGRRCLLERQCNVGLGVILCVKGSPCVPC